MVGDAAEGDGRLARQAVARDGGLGDEAVPVLLVVLDQLHRPRERLALRDLVAPIHLLLNAVVMHPGKYP